MKAQVRHKIAGLFMGISHGKGHYHIISECCRGLGVFCFTSEDLLEAFFEGADRDELPARARLKREDFTIEPWNIDMDNMLRDEGLLDDCDKWLEWSLKSFQVGSN